MSPGGQKGSLPSTPLILEGEEVPMTPAGGRETLDRSALSPMHPPRPLVIEEGEHESDETGKRVGRQVDALFSPMLNFLDDEKGEESEEDGGDREEGDADKPTTASETTATTAQETSQDEVEEEEAEEEVAEEEAYQHDEGEDDKDNQLVEDDGSSQGSLEEDEFNPYVFIKSLPSYDLVAPLRPPIALPPKDKAAPPISLVLDLDETLVHCTVEPVDDADLVFPVVFHGMTYQVHVRLRPFLFDFLEKIRGKYEVIVFTASQKVYANELLNLIDPGTLFQCFFLLCPIVCALRISLHFFVFLF